MEMNNVFANAFLLVGIITVILFTIKGVWDTVRNYFEEK